MTTYTVQGPSGKSYTIDGPDGATPDQLGRVILANNHDERVAATTAQMRSEYNPTNDMSTGGRLLAGIGRGYASVGRGLGQLVGLTSQGEVNDAKTTDAPLLATKAGKIGNAVGTGAALAPVAFVPGANTYAGAAGLGALTGAATTEGDAKDRALGAAGGLVGGVVGQGAGNLIAAGAGAVKAGIGNLIAKNAPKAAAVDAAQTAGYVLPPNQITPTLPNALIQAWGGPVKTTQAAATKNQATTNSLAARALGLPEDQPITVEALNGVRSAAGKAYDAVANAGEFNAAGANLPPIAGVKKSTDNLTLAPKTTVDAADLVAGWKQSNADATGYYQQYARDANPETLAKAKSSAADASAIHDFLTEQVGKKEAQTPADLMSALAKGQMTPAEFLQASIGNAARLNGKPGAVDALNSARTLIAKTYDVQKALKGSDVNAAVLAAAQNKKGTLTGDLASIADTANAFPKATLLPRETPSPFSAVDAGLGGLSLATHPMLAAGVLARPFVRAAALSPAGQSAAKFQPGPTTANAIAALLQSGATKRSLLSGGITGGVNLIGAANAQ